ncbi:MAG TPA: response regulator [Burkholderiaceae bacterium]
MPTRSCIVVADDNHDAADSLAQLLDLMGYDAVAVYDGQQAVRACHDLHPDLAILDVQMPGLDGCEAARRIRDDECPAPWLASLTGLRPQEEPLRSQHGVFDSHLSKPLRIEELSNLLARTTTYSR